MSVVNDKYRGSPQYIRVLAELVRAAEHRGVTTYRDIAVIMGLPLQGSHMGREVGHVLGEVCEDEVRADRPMLSAVAVGVNGKPGPGFFSLARELGRLTSDGDESDFWEADRLAVYEAWRRPLPSESLPSTACTDGFARRNQSTPCVMVLFEPLDSPIDSQRVTENAMALQGWAGMRCQVSFERSAVCVRVEQLRRPHPSLSSM